jgi:predicted nucleic acid-binding protein
MAYTIICNNCFIDEMTVDVWMCGARIYADLYEKRFTVGDSDILIAAYCIVNDCTLVTANTKDYENIDGLSIVNWVE